MVPTAFLHELHAFMHYIPVVPLITPVRPGDVATFSNGEYLLQRNESFTTTRLHATAAIRYASANSVAMSATAKAAGACDVDISFGREGAVLFDAAGCRINRVENPEDVALYLQSQREWNPKVFVVTEVIECDAALLLMSGKKGGKATLAVEGDLSVATHCLSSTGAKASLNLAACSGMVIQEQARSTNGEPLTVMFRALRWTKPWFRPPGARQVVAGEGDDMSSFVTADALASA